MTTKLQQFCKDILPVIQAGAKGARIGSTSKGSRSELSELNPEYDYITFNMQRHYQVIRRMIDVNGFLVSAGLSVAPPEKAQFYISDVGDVNFFTTDDWGGGHYDMKMLSRGLVYLNKQDAIARAKAMLGIDPYAEEEFDDAGDIPE